MTKILFFNSANIKKINFDGEDDLSWQKTPRVSSLFNTNEKTDICLYRLSENDVSPGDIITFNKLSALTKLYTTEYTMNDGFYPLFLVNQTLYFTDREDYSFMDGNWASDNVYKIDLEEKDCPVFTRYTPPAAPEGWEKCVIEQNRIRVKDLFGIVKDQSKTLKNFCCSNRGARLEIFYTDKYVKTELALIICIKFIQDIINEMGPTDYNVKIIGETFNEKYANSEATRRINSNFIREKNRDETGEKLTNDAHEHYSFSSEPQGRLPHYRELKIEATLNEETHTLIIMPDAGLAHWDLDIDKCREERRFYKTNQGINIEIPIRSNTSQTYFIGI